MKPLSSSILREAVQHHRSGRIDRAATLYRQAPQIDPDNLALLLSLGAIRLQQGQSGEAQSLFARATSLEPANADAWMALGDAQARSGEFVEADRAFARAAELRPEHAALHVNHGNVLRRLGRVEPAIASYLKAIALEPGLAQAHFNLGNALADRGSLDRAVDAFSAALAIKPDYLPARNNLGNVLLRQLRHEEAIRFYESVLAIDAGFPRVRYNLGVAQQALGLHADAVASFRTVLLDDATDLDALNNLCIELLRDDAPAEALTACERFLELSPANRKAMAYKAAALVELDNREKAGELLDYEHMVERVQIATPPGFQSLSDFNSALAQCIQDHPSLRYEPADKSTHGGSQTGELIRVPGHATAIPLQVLGSTIESAVSAYIARLRSTMPDHPYVAGLPRHWRLATWAVVLESQGYQGPHFHPDGAVSGVYYVQLPSVMGVTSSEAGSIEFGRTGDALGGSRPPLLEVVGPEAGLMLLFPSYFYHRTIPFESVEHRISVAFDVLADE